MTLVIDASVIVKWFYVEEGSDQARLVLEQDAFLVAPAHAAAEVGHVLLRRVRDGRLSLPAMESALSGLSRTVAWIPLDALYADANAVAMGTGASFYDALYVAAAVGWQASLVTADRRLLRMLAGTRWAPSVIDLPDWVAALRAP